MQTNKSKGQMTAQVDIDAIKKSGFDLSSNFYATGRIGRIIPTRCMDVYPGDKIYSESKVAVQFEPLAVPILANMKVKQESFYVPFNTVWQNWDKFISGGEQLDYNGVVPNITMKDIIDTINNKFHSLFIDVQFANDIVIGDNKYNAFISLDTTLDNIETVITSLTSIGDLHQCKDLLKPQFEAVESFRKYILEHCNFDTEQSIENGLFVINESFGTLSDVERIAIAQVYNQEYCGNNKYFNEIIPFLVYNQLDEFYPTELCLNLMQIVYEFFKSLIGLSSNIDYLNAGRVLLTEFIISYLNDFTVARTNNEGTNMYLYLSSVNFNSNVIRILALRANYSVWYNNYRDVLLETTAPEPAISDNITEDEIFHLILPRQRCWAKDAFTTALDNPGTGNVGVPVGVYHADSGINYKAFVQNTDATYGSLPDLNDMYKVELDGIEWRLPTSFLSGINKQFTGDDHTISNGFSLYQLDAAQRAQKWLQKALFFGNRIADFYYMHYGVRFLDSRLRIPEWLQSSEELVKLDVVMNNTNITTEAGGNIYQSVAGDRSAYASAYDDGKRFERYCEEHGVILSYLTIMPETTYAYGMSRDYAKLDQFDYRFHEFATLGMDAVYDTEISTTSLNPTAFQTLLTPQVFGYQGKYYDSKWKQSEEHGELLDTQDMYTFARKFNMLLEDSRPKLNYEFVHCFPPLDMFVVDNASSDYFRFDVRHQCAGEIGLPPFSLYI